MPSRRQPPSVELGVLPASGGGLGGGPGGGLHEPLLALDIAPGTALGAQAEEPHDEFESFDGSGAGDTSFGSETWFQFLSSTRPLPGSQGTVTIRSAIVCLAVVPLALFLIGMVIDEILHGTLIFFHSTCLLSVGYIVAPFSILYANWPRQTVFNHHLAKGSRVVWDILLSICFLASLLVYSQTLATSDPQAAFVYQTAETIFAGYNNVTDVTSFWNYVKDDLGSTLFQTRVYPCMYYDPAFNGTDSTVCTAPWGGGGRWCDMANPDDLAVCHEPDPVPADETCVNKESILIGDIPYRGVSNGLLIRQVRTKSVSKSYGGEFNSIYPPFALDNEDDEPWGQGRQWHDRYPTVTKYREQAMAALVLSFNCTFNDRNLGFLPMDYPLVGWPDDGGNLTGSNMTWPGVLTGSAWYYNDGTHQNLPGRTVKPPVSSGPSRLTSYPPGGFTWTIPGANSFFLRAGAVSAANTLQSQHWIDEQTRLVTIQYLMVAYNSNKWVTISVDFEFTASGKILSSLSSSFGNLDSVFDQETNTDRWPSYFVNWYYMVMTFTVYYFSTFVIKFHEHGSFRAVYKKEMIKMDILVHLLIITAWCILLESVYYWPGDSPGVNMVARSYSLYGSIQPLGIQLLPITTAGMWQTSRDFVGIALILQWLRFIEYLVLVPYVGVVPRAIILGLGTVAYFLITMIFILAAFVSGFNMIYSVTTTHFSTPAQTVLTLWSALLGNVDVDDFISSRYYVGIGLFLFFSFFTLFVFLTMLMAVIGDAYERAKCEAAEAEEKVNKVVSPDMPSRKALALKVEGYFDHFRTLEC